MWSGDRERGLKMALALPSTVKGTILRMVVLGRAVCTLLLGLGLETI